MQRLLELTTQMEHSVSASTLRSIVEVVKVDHLVFKFQVYRAFFGLNNMGPSEVADHTACRLGNWYYTGDGHQYYSKLPGYRELESPHAAVHRAGREAVEALRSGDPMRGADAVGRMEEASISVIDALERIAREGESSPDLFHRQ